MSRHLRRIVLILTLASVAILAPAPAYADVGSTIAGRLWDSLRTTLSNRIQSNAPATVKLLQEAEKIFLGQTEDVTAMTAVQDVYGAMRHVGLILLAFCTVISLVELSEAGLMGHSGNLTDWFKRFVVATFMTMGSIYVHGFWIRLFNGLLEGLRGYLATHYQGTSDPSALYTYLIPQLQMADSLLMLLFLLIALVVLFVLWFLIGGIRMAEIALSVIIAPLLWPCYLVTSMEDIPKRAFRGFLGLTGVLLIIVPMLHLAVRWVSGGGINNTVWNFVPAISMLLLTVFTPSLVKQIVGQGHTGVGGLMTVLSMAAGLKGISMATAAGASVARPPAAAAIPQAPATPSASPIAPVQAGGGGMVPSPAAASRPEVWVDTPAALPMGQPLTRPAAIGAPFTPTSGEPCVVDLGQSTNGRWDRVAGIRKFEDGAYNAKRINLPETKGDED